MASPTDDSLSNAGIYADLRADMIELARALSTTDEARLVPQCPEWSIKGVYAHVVGINADVLSGNVDGIGSDQWTAAQVKQRASMTLSEVCDEWEELAPTFDALGAARPLTARNITGDLITHHHDVLAALGWPGDPNSAAVRVALGRYGPLFVERAAEAGLPVVLVNAGERSWKSNDGDPVAVVRASEFELLRAFTGRRSLAQVRAMSWEGDSEPYLAVVTPYGLPTEDVVDLLV
jgi:uncharacterized protein (TIGR03083 family)